MSTITVDKNGILDVVSGLRALQAMTAEYEAFSVSFGQSRGPQAVALSEAAMRVAALAQAQDELLEQIIRGIVYDAEALGTVDAELAQALLAEGSAAS